MSRTEKGAEVVESEGGVGEEPGELSPLERGYGVRPREREWEIVWELGRGLCEETCKSSGSEEELVFLE